MAKTARKTKSGATLALVPQVKSPPMPKSMLEIIAQATINPACDVAKMQALFAIQREIEGDQARKSFTRAFNALQYELPTIRRDGKIDHSVGGSGVTRTGKRAAVSRYATYPNLMSVVNPLLKKHGFTFSNATEPSADGSHIVVTGTLEHVDGHFRQSRFPLPLDTTGAKNNLQGWGSAQQYGMRYNAIALLNIVSEAPEDSDRDGYRHQAAPRDDAGDDARQAQSTPDDRNVTKDAGTAGGSARSDFPGDKPWTITAAEQEELRLVIEDCGVAMKVVLDKYAIKKLADLPVSLLKDVKNACANYKAAHQPKAPKR